MTHYTQLGDDFDPEPTVKRRVRLKANPVSPIFDEPPPTERIINEQPQSPLIENPQPTTSTPLHTPVPMQLRPRQHHKSYNWKQLEMQVRRQQTEDGHVENLLTLGPKSPDRD